MHGDVVKVGWVGVWTMCVSWLLLTREAELRISRFTSIFLGVSVDQQIWC